MTLNCPACGVSVPTRIKFSKLVVCDYCRMALFLEDDTVRQAGKMSVLADRPSLLKMGQRFSLEKASWLPVGRIRYQYSKGDWDEWWIIRDDGDACWMSIDEGDLALERPVETNSLLLPGFKTLTIGQELEIAGTLAVVTEKDHCCLTGAEGELPFTINEGDAHDYVDLSGPDGTLYSIEYCPDGIEVFKGEWVDPFTVKY